MKRNKREMQVPILRGSEFHVPFFCPLSESFILHSPGYAVPPLQSAGSPLSRGRFRILLLLHLVLLHLDHFPVILFLDLSAHFHLFPDKGQQLIALATLV